MRTKRIVMILALVLSAAAAVQAQNTVPAGTDVKVTLNQAVSSKDAKVGDKVDGSVAENVVVNGKTLIPRGARANLSVTTVEASGRLSGVAKLWLKIDSLTMNGRTYTVNSEVSGQDGTSHNKRNVIAIGGGAAAGAIIGGIAGGGKGAAIGTAIGAGAGTAGATATGKKDINYPAETQLRFSLKSALNLGSASSKGKKKGHA